MLPSPSLQIADRWTFFSRILVWFCGFYPQYFLNRKRERKTTRRYARKRCRHNPAFWFHKKSVIPVLEPPFFPTKLFYGHMRDRKTTWRQERASYAGRYSRYHCFIVQSFAGTKDCHLRVQQNTSLTHSQQRRQVRLILVGFGLHVTDCPLGLRGRCWNPRSAKRTRKERNTRAYFVTNFPSVNSKMKGISSVFRLFLLICTPYVATWPDMVLVHDANLSKILLKPKWIRFWFFQFCGFYHCVSVLRETLRISVEIRTNTGAWQHCRKIILRVWASGTTALTSKNHILGYTLDFIFLR